MNGVKAFSDMIDFSSIHKKEHGCVPSIEWDSFVQRGEIWSDGLGLWLKMEDYFSN